MLYYCQTGKRNYGNSPVRIYMRPYWEFMIFLKGKACPSFSREERTNENHNFWIFRPDCSHGWNDETKKECEVAVFHFASVPPALEERMKLSPRLSCELSADLREEIKNIALSVKDQVKKPGPNSQMLFQLTLLRLTYLFLENSDLSPVPASREEQIVNAAVAWFSSHMEEGVGVRETAEKMGYDVSHLRRMFQKVKGRSPREELLDVKMARARGLLRQGSSVLDTALACGFNSHSSFTRAFTSFTGKPPRYYLT